MSITHDMRKVENLKVWKNNLDFEGIVSIKDADDSEQ